MPAFHDKPFDDSTLAKLSIFRGYIREWLSVFMTDRLYQRNYKAELQIFDFFAGPGYDSENNAGSPVIITEEIKNYCLQRQEYKADVNIKLFFNDAEPLNIDKLKKRIVGISCKKGCCNVIFSANDFSIALNEYLPLIRKQNIANLIIMDQFGVKEVTPEIVRLFSECRKTDILFFISSSIIKRFCELPEIKNRFQIKPDEVKDIEYKTIHRYICEYYRENVKGIEYYLAPFSIQKGANIYGIIFGSSSLRGLEKFLKICWDNDKKTGEANYNIDNDCCYNGQLSIFENENQFKKINQFQNEIIEYVKKENPDNKMMYKYVLTKGFSVTKSNEVLNELQKKGLISTYEIKSGKSARKASFYIEYKYYTQEPKIKFKV